MKISNHEVWPGGDPVIGARVFLYPGSPVHPNPNEPIAETMTDGRGYWEFDNVAGNNLYDVLAAIYKSEPEPDEDPISHRKWYKGL